MSSTGGGGNGGGAAYEENEVNIATASAIRAGGSGSAAGSSSFGYPRNNDNSSSSSSSFGSAGGGFASAARAGGGAASAGINGNEETSNLLHMFTSIASRLDRVTEFTGNEASRERLLTLLTTIARMLNLATDGQVTPVNMRELSVSAAGATMRGTASLAAAGGKLAVAGGKLAASTTADTLESVYNAALSETASKTVEAILKSAYNLISRTPDLITNISTVIGAIFTSMIQLINISQEGVWKAVTWTSVWMTLFYGYIERRSTEGSQPTLLQYFMEHNGLPSGVTFSSVREKKLGVEFTQFNCLMQLLVNDALELANATVNSMERTTLESETGKVETSGAEHMRRNFYSADMLARSTEEYTKVMSSLAVRIILLKDMICIESDERERKFAKLEAAQLRFAPKQRSVLKISDWGYILWDAVVGKCVSRPKAGKLLERHVSGFTTREGESVRIISPAEIVRLYYFMWDIFLNTPKNRESPEYRTLTRLYNGNAVLFQLKDLNDAAFPTQESKNEELMKRLKAAYQVVAGRNIDDYCKRNLEANVEASCALPPRESPYLSTEGGAGGSVAPSAPPFNAVAPGKRGGPIFSSSAPPSFFPSTASAEGGSIPPTASAGFRPLEHYFPLKTGPQVSALPFNDISTKGKRKMGNISRNDGGLSSGIEKEKEEPDGGKSYVIEEEGEGEESKGGGNSSTAAPPAKRYFQTLAEKEKKEQGGGARRTRYRKNRRSHKKVRKVKKQVRKTRHHKKRSTRRR